MWDFLGPDDLYRAGELPDEPIAYFERYGEFPTEPIVVPDPNAPAPVQPTCNTRRTIVCRTTTGNVIVHVLDTTDALELERAAAGL